MSVPWPSEEEDGEDGRMANIDSARIQEPGATKKAPANFHQSPLASDSKSVYCVELTFQ